MRFIIFDLGGVLIDWDPRHLYRKLLSEEEAEAFLRDVVHPTWNAQMDAGVRFAEAIAERIGAHPDRASLIQAYFDRWPEMLGGAIEGTVEILRELEDGGTPLYALTNWSDETFRHAEERFRFLEAFRDIVVSGRERVVKPAPEIYRRLLERHDLDPAQGLFIDDVEKNVEGARDQGLDAVRFRGPDRLREDLVARGWLGGDGSGDRGRGGPGPDRPRDPTPDPMPDRH